MVSVALEAPKLTGKPKPHHPTFPCPCRPWSLPSPCFLSVFPDCCFLYLGGDFSSAVGPGKPELPASALQGAIIGMKSPRVPATGNKSQSLRLYMASLGPAAPAVSK